MAFGGTEFGGTPFGTAPFGWDDTSPATATTISRDLFTLELWTSADVLAYRLPNWGECSWSQAINEPATLEFTYPLNEDPVAYMVYPNQVALSCEDGAVIDLFHIATRTKARAADGTAIVKILAESVLAQLGRELVDLYEPGSQTINQIVRDLLNDYQQNTMVTNVGLGGIDAAIGGETREVKWEKRTVLQCLRELQDGIGGYFYVTVNDAGLRQFWWKRLKSAWAGQQVRLHKNLQSLEVTDDYRTIRTRLLGRGAGVSDDYCLTKTTNSDNQATYGIIQELVADRTIGTQDQLDKLLDSLIDTVKVPQRTIRCGAIDLSFCDNSRLDFSHEALGLGTRIRIIDDVLDEVLDTAIVKITRDLARPMGVTIEVANPEAGPLAWDGGVGGPERTGDIVDTIAEIIEQQRDNAAQDTGVLNDVGDWWEDNSNIPIADMDEILTPDRLNDDTVGSATGMRDDGTNFPYMKRIFIASDMNGVAAMEANGLSFRDGDQAYTSANHMYWDRTNGVWNPPIAQTVMGVNAGSAQINQYEPAVITGFLWDATTFYVTVRPVEAADTWTDPFAVAWENVPASSAGKVILSGLAIAKISTTYPLTWPQYVAIDGASYTDKLRQWSDRGWAMLLSNIGGPPGVYDLALIRFGNYIAP